jgi:SAM-dependent methyltransferase
MNNDKVCTLCNSKKLKTWGHKNGFDLFFCTYCHHRFADISKIQQFKDDKSFRDFITSNKMESDDQYYKYLCSGEKRGAHTFVTTNLIIKNINAFLNPINKTWLDVGSGSGYLVAELRKKGWDATGLEAGGWGQIAATDKNISIDRCFLQELNYSKQYDVISATDVLEHQSDPNSFIHSIIKHLKPNGLMIFSFPFADSFHGRFLKTNWEMVVPPSHCHFFNRRSLSIALNKYGFEIVKLIQYNSSSARFFRRYQVLKFAFKTFINLLHVGDQAIAFVKK